MPSEFERLSRTLAPDYRLEHELGPDPLGAVYRALATDDTPVTLTVLSRDLTRRMPTPERFLTEIQRAAELQHTSLLPILASGVSTAGDVYLATVDVSGRAARERFAQPGMVPAEALGRTGAAVANALAVAHHAGMVHGAVSPSRLFVDDDQVWLGGLGIHAGLLAAGLPPLEVNDLLGAAAYMSPEQLAARPLEARSDVYALGATLYELLTGKPPFGGRTTSVVMASVLADEPARPDPSGAQAPGQTVGAILRAIEKDPEDRWMSAVALLEPVAAAGAPGSRAGRGCLPMVVVVSLAIVMPLIWLSA
jgi:serine/threonine protein kinase